MYSILYICILLPYLFQELCNQNLKQHSWLRSKTLFKPLLKRLEQAKVFFLLIALDHHSSRFTVLFCGFGWRLESWELHLGGGLEQEGQGWLPTDLNKRSRTAKVQVHKYLEDQECVETIHHQEIPENSHFLRCGLTPSGPTTSEWSFGCQTILQEWRATPWPQRIPHISFRFPKKRTDNRKTKKEMREEGTRNGLLTCVVRFEQNSSYLADLCSKDSLRIPCPFGTKETRMAHDAGWGLPSVWR